MQQQAQIHWMRTHVSPACWLTRGILVLLPHRIWKKTCLIWYRSVNFKCVPSENDWRVGTFSHRSNWDDFRCSPDPAVS